MPEGVRVGMIRPQLQRDELGRKGHLERGSDLQSAQSDLTARQQGDKCPNHTSSLPLPPAKALRSQKTRGAMDTACEAQSGKLGGEECGGEKGRQSVQQVSKLTPSHDGSRASRELACVLL